MGSAQEGEAGDTQRQGTAQEQPSERPPPLIRVDVVEDQSEAEARRASEERAQKRELDDLAAQQGMNEATQKMADYAVYQTVLIAIGTALLLYTLWLTRQANEAAVEGAKAAQGAVTETRRIGEAQVRAYVLCDSCDVHAFAIGLKPYATVHFSNCGQSPATRLRVSGTIVVAEFPQKRSYKPLFARMSDADIGQAQGQRGTTTVKRFISLTDEEHAGILAGTAALYVNVAIKFTDVFGAENSSHTVYVYSKEEYEKRSNSSVALYGHSSAWGTRQAAE